MINDNGEIKNKETLSNNRAFLYGDALFDTLVYKNENFQFLEEHYFRLLSGMRQLHMKIPKKFTQIFWKKEMQKIVMFQNYQSARIRTSIYRESPGLYTPNSHEVHFLIQASELNRSDKKNYTLGIYKDNFLGTSPLNTIKTTNRITNVLAAIFAKENGFDNLLLLNYKKRIAEVINANIFCVFGNTIKTPALTEGCIKGIIRQKVIELIQSIHGFVIEETTLSPSDLNDADEIFITNSIMGIQSISNYKNREYSSKISNQFKQILFI